MGMAPRPDSKEDILMNDDRPDIHLDKTPTGHLDEALPGSTLVPLGRLRNYRVAAGDPDVRGWRVLGADGRVIGEVDDILVDTEAMRVRYLDVTLDSERGDEVFRPVAEAAAAGGPSSAVLGEAATATGAMTPLANPGTAAVMGGTSPLISESLLRSTLSPEENALTREHHHGYGGRHVLVPIGIARLDPEHDRILVEGLRAEDAPGLPDYRGQDVTREMESGLRQRFDNAYTHSAEGDFYSHDLYDADRFYAPRREAARQAGLEPGGAAPVSGNREITGELDRAVDVPEEAPLPGRGR
jgi:hypothetical protein